MKVLIFFITLVFLSCDNLPSKNDILNHNRPVPISNLTDFDIKVVNAEHNTIVRDHPFELTENRFKTSLISNIREPNRLFDGQNNDQKLYRFIFESKRPLEFDNMDSIFIDFSIDFDYEIFNYKDSMVFIYELNRKINILMTKDNNIIYPVIEFSPFNDPEAYELVYSRFGVNESVMKKFRDARNPVNVRVSMILKSYLLETNAFPFVYAETDYNIKFEVNGFY